MRELRGLAAAGGGARWAGCGSELAGHTRALAIEKGIGGTETSSTRSVALAMHLALLSLPSTACSSNLEKKAAYLSTTCQFKESEDQRG